MQRWNDELTKHPLNVTVKQVLDLIDRDIEIEDPVVEAERVRFAKVIRLLESTLRSLDPEIAPIEILDLIYNQFSSLGILEVAQGVAQGDEADALRALNTKLSPVISLIVQLRSAARGLDSEKVGLKSSTDAFEKFLRLIDRRKREYENATQVAEEKLAFAKDSIENLEYQLREDLKLHKTNIQKIEHEAATLISEQRAGFSEANSQNAAKFSALIEQMKTDAGAKLKELLDAEKDVAKTRQDELRSDSENMFKSAKELHDKIKSLYGLVATDSVAGGHVSIADRELASAQVWQKTTVGSIVAAIIWIIYSIFCLQPTLEPAQVFWLQIGKSISLTALLLSLAVYASKQAALHRMNERRFRSFFLQVQAFDPFIESLSDLDKQELKKDLSKRIFGPEDVRPDDAVLDPSALGEVEKMVGFLERVGKLK